jgi:hypothetical protein
MSLISPNALLRKRRASGAAKLLIKRSDLEHPPFERDPTNFILAALS